MSPQSLGLHKHPMFWILILFDRFIEPKYLLLVPEVRLMLWFTCSYTLLELLEGAAKGSI